MLSTLLPNGTDRWVALLTELPDDTGAGGTEAVDDGNDYARVAWDAWVDDPGATYYRMNDGSIPFVVLADSLSGVVGWAIYDAVTAGNLLAFGEILDIGGTAVTKNFVAGDIPLFDDQCLKVALG